MQTRIKKQVLNERLCQRLWATFYQQLTSYQGIVLRLKKMLIVTNEMLIEMY